MLFLGQDSYRNALPKYVGYDDTYITSKIVHDKCTFTSVCEVMLEGVCACVCEGECVHMLENDDQLACPG